MTESENERCPTCGSDDRLFKFQMGCFDRWHDSAAPTAPQVGQVYYDMATNPRDHKFNAEIGAGPSVRRGKL